MPENDDLFFFGRVSASVSHELKNILAVINEQAGLLDDLSRLAGRGMPLDPERLALAASCLLKQVRRGDAILTHLNRFAHTADAPRREVSLAETAALAVALGERQASMRQVALSATPGPDARVSTDPFVLCRLLALCLEWAMAAPDTGKTVAVCVEAGGDGAGPALVVTGLAPDAAPVDDGPGQALAARIGARLVRQPGRVAIVWP
ncbi:histidine kinase A domain protein [Solidesulfovibrio carbinoliphilus subsp. oakridgensis]|uniref:histidine kinase n=1 Tax=Solidesulfovibrio carbinoliphilus subsp. oakridgensis TaxID=694327 RepID=G7Q7B4_9BACT|nr:HAMP domain-containing histidine kinase [Solidesulfovibrio carbinoliphilus]EHJ49071.1 histidine kinase A domain protein [Solidesulfovibrio carbinoliphilus subsp. oakridgensis]